MTKKNSLRSLKGESVKFLLNTSCELQSDARLTFHRRCADRAGLWGSRIGPDICCRSGTACQSGGRQDWE